MNSKLFFLLLINIISGEPRFLSSSPDPDLSYYTNCDLGSVIMNYQSNFYLDIGNQPFDGSSCDAFQNNDNYHTWCITPDSFIWSTIREKFLGLKELGNTYVLYTSSTLDTASQQWTFTLQSTNFQTITQTINGVTYALMQISTDYGDNDDAPLNPIVVGVDIYDSTELKQHWWISQIGRREAQTSPICAVNIESAQFPNVFLSSQPCLVLLQYGAYDSESWFLELSGKQLYCVRSDKWGHYLSFDGTGCTIKTDSGCGSTTTSPTCGPNEMFAINSNNDLSNEGTVALISNAFPNVALRLDGNGINSFQGPGGGMVNGQVIDDFNDTDGNEIVFITNGTANSLPVGDNLVIVRGYITNGDTNALLSSDDLTNFPMSISFWGNGLMVYATISPETGIYDTMLPPGIYQRMAVIPSNINEITLSVFVNVSADSPETDSDNTIFVYAQNTTAIPIEGCVWLQTCIFSIFEICNDIPDFRALYADKIIIAVTVGPNTKVTLFDNYVYTGNSQIIMTSGTTILTDFYGQASSVSVVPMFTVQGYLMNAQTNYLISSDILTSQNPVVIFIDTDNDQSYSATIISDSGMYSVVLYPGTFVRAATMNLFLSTTMTMIYASDSDCDESNDDNTVLFVPINITIEGYLQNEETNNLISSENLSSSNSIVTFIGNGQIFSATILPDSGMYSVVLTPGNYVRSVTIDQFVPTSTNMSYASDSDETNIDNTVLLVPVFDGWRAVLTWNENIYPNFHTYIQLPTDEFVGYGHNLSINGEVILTIDNQDETTKFAFSSTSQGLYDYYVVSYTDQTVFTQSQVNVVVYYGTSQVAEIVVASSGNQTNYWHVFSITVNGNDQIYQEINAFESGTN